MDVDIKFFEVILDQYQMGEKQYTGFETDTLTPGMLRNGARVLPIGASTSASVSPSHTFLSSARVNKVYFDVVSFVIQFSSSLPCLAVGTRYIHRLQLLKASRFIKN